MYFIFSFISEKFADTIESLRSSPLISKADSFRIRAVASECYEIHLISGRRVTYLTLNKSQYIGFITQCIQEKGKMDGIFRDPKVKINTDFLNLEMEQENEQKAK